MWGKNVVKVWRKKKESIKYDKYGLLKCAAIAVWPAPVPEGLRQCSAVLEENSRIGTGGGRKSGNWLECASCPKRFWWTRDLRGSNRSRPDAHPQRTATETWPAKTSTAKVPKDIERLHPLNFLTARWKRIQIKWLPLKITWLFFHNLSSYDRRWLQYCKTTIFISCEPLS